MNYIEFGLPIKSLKYWLLQLFPIFVFFRNLIQSVLIEKFQLDKPNIMINYLGIAIFMFIGELCAGIIILTKQLLKKRNENETKTTSSYLKKLSSKSEKKMKIKVIKAQSHKQWGYIVLFLVLSSFVDGSTLVFLESTSQIYINGIRFQLQTTELIFCAIFSRLILKKLFYKHQLVSFVLICLGVILLNISPLDYSSQSVWIQIGIFFGCFICWGFQDAIIKWLMDVMFIEPETILFSQGIIGLVMIIGFGVIEYAFDTIVDGDITCFDFIGYTFTSWTTVLLFMCYFIFSFIYNYMIFLLTKFYSPTQKIISDFIMSLFVAIYIKATYEKKVLYWEWIMLAIGFCLNFIGCLLYDEIIIVNIWDLGVNTKERIQKRSLEDENFCRESILTLNSSQDDDNSELIDLA